MQNCLHKHSTIYLLTQGRNQKSDHNSGTLNKNQLKNDETFRVSLPPKSNPLAFPQQFVFNSKNCQKFADDLLF
jgi:hypothetical protein